MPAILVLSGGGGNIGNGSWLSGSSDPGPYESTGPPGSIWAEIELEVAGAVGGQEEKLGSIIFPEILLVFRGFAFGMKEARAGFVAGEEVKVGVVDPEEVADWMGDFLAGPCRRNQSAVEFKVLKSGAAR